MSESIREELEELSKTNKDVVQAYADKYGISRSLAKAYLFPILYGSLPTQIKSITSKRVGK